MTVLTETRQAELQRALNEACHSVGLDPAGGQILAYSSNLVYRLVSAPVVVRLNLHADHAEQATRLVHIAEWLQKQGSPIAPVVNGLRQPIIRDGWSATFWVALDRSHQMAAAALATPLRMFHQLAPASGLPTWDKFAYGHAHLEHATDISADDHAWLTDAWMQAEDDYRACAEEMPHGVIHGDAHSGNLLRDNEGQAVLCDLDNVTYGPLDWDLTPMAVSSARFHRPDNQTAFAAAYGRDVTAVPWWPVLRRIRELVMVTYVITDLRSRPAVANNWAHRMRTLRANQTNALWQPF